MSVVGSRGPVFLTVAAPPGKAVYVIREFDTKHGGDRPCRVGEFLIVVEHAAACDHKPCDHKQRHHGVPEDGILVWRKSIPEGKGHHLDHKCWWISNQELEENTTCDPAEVALAVLAT